MGKTYCIWMSYTGIHCKTLHSYFNSPESQVFVHLYAFSNCIVGPRSLPTFGSHMQHKNVSNYFSGNFKKITLQFKKWLFYWHFSSLKLCIVWVEQIVNFHWISPTLFRVVPWQYKSKAVRDRLAMYSMASAVKKKNCIKL